MGENRENPKAAALKYTNVLKDGETHRQDPENGPTKDEIFMAADGLWDMMHSEDPDQLAALKEAVWEVAGTNRDTALDLLLYMTRRSFNHLEIDDLAFLGIEKLLGKDEWFYGKSGELARSNELDAELPTTDEFDGLVRITNHGANGTPMFEIYIYALPKYGEFEGVSFRGGMSFHEENLLDTSTDFASQIKARLATLKVECPEYFPE